MVAGWTASWGSNTPGIRHIASYSTTSTPSSPACELAALNSSASWSATRTAGGLCYVRGPEGAIIELAERIG
jgi:hypothetical protein